MTKTPFEIRLDLLAMAQNILTEQRMNDRVKAENDWGLLREKASIRLSEGDQNVYLPPFPEVNHVTDDEIISMAEKLNKFVSNG